MFSWGRLVEGGGMMVGWLDCGANRVSCNIIKTYIDKLHPLNPKMRVGWWTTTCKHESTCALRSKFQVLSELLEEEMWYVVVFGVLFNVIMGVENIDVDEVGDLGTIRGVLGDGSSSVMDGCDNG
ncbi:hypothetical protein Tco_0672929 [Tanacetum coccineum]